MAKTKKISDYDNEMRLVSVQDLMVERKSGAYILNHILINGWGNKKYAEELIKTALKRWASEFKIDLEVRRQRSVLRYLVMASTLKEKFKGTPPGIKALVEIEKEINKLEGNYSPEVIEHGFNGDTLMDNPVNIIIGGRRKGEDD